MAISNFDRIADFRFVHLLGSGSFAHTYEAVRDGEQFAVKVFYDLPATGEAADNRICVESRHTQRRREQPDHGEER